MTRKDSEEKSEMNNLDVSLDEIMALEKFYNKNWSDDASIDSILKAAKSLPKKRSADEAQLEASGSDNGENATQQNDYSDLSSLEDFSDNDDLRREACNQLKELDQQMKSIEKQLANEKLSMIELELSNLSKAKHLATIESLREKRLNMLEIYTIKSIESIEKEYECRLYQIEFEIQSEKRSLQQEMFGHLHAKKLKAKEEYKKIKDSGRLKALQNQNPHLKEITTDPYLIPAWETKCIPTLSKQCMCGLDDKEIEDDLALIQGKDVDFSDSDDFPGETEDAQVCVTPEGYLMFRNHLYRTGDSIVVENRKGTRNLGVIVSISQAEVRAVYSDLDSKAG